MTDEIIVRAGSPAPDMTLPDDSGTQISLSNLWSERPLVLMFIRHLGWTFCREHVVDVRNEYSQFQRAGGEVAVVVMAEPKQAAAFRSRYKLPFRLLADPQCQAYRAFGLQRGNVWKVAGPAIWVAGLKSFVRHGAGKPVGDPLQLAGTFVIDQDGIVRYRHHAANSADRPTNAELIAALELL